MKKTWRSSNTVLGSFPCHLKCPLLVLALLIFSAGTTAQTDRLANFEGVVTDQFGGSVVAAKIILKSSDKSFSSITNNKGLFRVKNIHVGEYILQVSATGFGLHEAMIKHTSNTIPVNIVLYPTIKENVDVRGDAEILDPEKLAGTLVLGRSELEDLPDDPEELADELQNLATSSGSAPGNAIVTVDGFLNEGRLPSKSAIREVRVNPNLFSAEYNFPPFRGGRIEITTKPGSGKFAGSAFINFNDDIFNARNPFAVERADTQTKRYGFQIGSPLIKNRSGFFIDFEKRDIDDSSTVNAVILDDNFQTTNFTSSVPNPQRLSLGSFRNDWQLNEKHSLIFRYIFNSNKVNNQGIGGINLPNRATDYKQTENIFRFSETAVIDAKTVNEFRLGFTIRNTNQKALSNEPIINLAGASVSGGADLEKLSLKEKDLEISNNLVTEAGKHILKIGTQIFSYNTDDFRRENQNGTFLFGGREINENGSFVTISGPEQYRRTLLGLDGGVPTRYSVNLGEPSVSTNQWLFAAYIQDEWIVNKSVLISLGLRAESQTLPNDKLRFAPRMSVAYSPGKKQKWAIRARAGVFYQRISDSLHLTADRLDGTNQRRILIDNPAFPNPFLSGQSIEIIPTRRTLDPKLKAPGSLQMRVELRRELPQGWSVSSSYSWTRSWNQFRSRNINAPIISTESPNPETAPRPLGTSENILQFESSGRLRGNVLYIGVNQNTNKFFSLNMGYLNFNFKTDADNVFSFPQSSYNLEGEYATPAWHARHRMFLSSRLNLPWNLRLATSINASSGRPFNVTTGQDNNGDGIFNDRPNVSSSADSQAIETQFGFLNPNVTNGNLQRNIGTNPSNFNVSVNLRRTFILKKRKESSFRLTANIRARNLFNRTNLNGLNGVLNSPFFGRAFSARPARQIEFGLRFNF